MNIYNVKITEFLNEIRVTTYDKAIISGKAKKKSNPIIKTDKKIKNIYDLGWKRYKDLLSRDLSNGTDLNYVTDEEMRLYHRDGYYHYMIENMQELKIVQAKSDINSKIRKMKLKKKNLYKSKNDSLSRAIQKAYNIGKSNNWEWFITLTFNKDKVDRFDYAAVTQKLSTWLNNAKKKNLEMKYIAIPELHKKRGYHFHLLASNVNDLQFIKSGKLSYGKYKVNDYEPYPKWVKDKSKLKTIYNIDNYNLGWSTATKIQDNERSIGYILKYLNKDLGEAVPIGKKKYWASKNVNIPSEEKIYIPTKEIVKVVKGKDIKFIKKNPLRNYIKSLKKSNPKFMKEIEVTGEYENKINIIEFKKDNETYI